MNLKDLKNTEQLQTFLDGAQAVAFSVPGDKAARYSFIQSTLKQFHYRALNKRQKGIVIRFLLQVTGYSRQQLTRLIHQYLKAGVVQQRLPHKPPGFKQKYTATDVALLAEMDERHNTPSGAVIKKLCERACSVFNETEYENIAAISVSHLYNLRGSTRYQKQRRTFEKTKSRQVALGERRKPNAEGKPGYIRVDTVHQGDQDGVKGVYHINAVDEITQYEVVLSCSRISEQFLIPVLTEMLEIFPFNIKGFHADNGSEYINQQVAKLLNKLHIELTKSRSRHSNDNALAESKNASVVRKTFGYNHIEQHWADELNVFNREHLNPFLNYHRPCYFPTIAIDDKGKERKKYHYDKMMTPYEKLKSLDNAKDYLKEPLSFEQLDKEAYKISDNKAADKMNLAKKQLFKQIYEQ
ncbi:MAG: transposase family protein, partial [Methylococcales bacterium]|nr:transposase family protein [Methylococcales bacterium]